MDIPSPPTGICLFTADRALSDQIQALVGATGQSMEKYETTDDLIDLLGGLALVDARLTPKRLPITASRGSRGDSAVNVVVLDVVGDASAWDFASKIGAQAVIVWPAGSAHLAERMREYRDTHHPPGRLVAVTGGRGGCGATTLAVGLTVAGSTLGQHSVLIDVDSGSADIRSRLGLTATSGGSWSDFANISESLPPQDIRGHLASRFPWSLLAGPWGAPDSRGEILRSCRRAFDLTIIDLPRYELANTPLPPGSLLVPITTLESASLIRVREMTRSATGVFCPLVVARPIGPVPLRSARDLLGLTPIHMLGSFRGLRGSSDFGLLPDATGRGRAARNFHSILQKTVKQSRDIGPPEQKRIGGRLDQTATQNLSKPDRTP